MCITHTRGRNLNRKEYLDQVKNWINTEFPDNLKGEAGEIGIIEGYVYDSEKLNMELSSASRKQEFLSGRILCRRALSLLEVTHGAILKAPNGCPEWSDIITGSISHKGKVCVVVVGKKDSYLSLGVDIDIDKAMTPDVWKYFVQQGEIANICDKNRFANILFVCKEAVYKCLVQLNNVYEEIDFKDIFIYLDENYSETQCFRCIVDSIILLGKVTIIGPAVIACAYYRSELA